MILVFFDSKGLIYTHIMPRGALINAKFILVVLGKLLVHLRKKRPEMVKRDWFFPWDNAPVHGAAVVKSWLAAKAFKVLKHPSFLPDPTPADFFWFQRVNEELSGLTLSQESLNNTSVGVIRTIAEEEFAVASRRRFERCQKCIRIDSGYV